MKGKGVRKPKPSGAYKKWRRKDSAWADLAGPLRPEWGRFRYFMVVVRWDGSCSVFFLETKREAYTKLDEYCNENPTVVRLRTDNGGEFVSGLFRGKCRENKIQLDFTSPEHPEENSSAENAVKNLSINTRTLLLGAPNFPKTHWPLAMSYANWLGERLPKRSLGGATAYENKHGRKPHLGDARCFGEEVFYKVKTRDRGGKFDEVFKPAIFVGCSDNSKDLLLIHEEDLKKPLNRKLIFRNSEVKLYGGEDYAKRISQHEIRVKEAAETEEEEEEVKFEAEEIFPAFGARRVAHPAGETLFDFFRCFLACYVAILRLFCENLAVHDRGQKHVGHDIYQAFILNNRNATGVVPPRKHAAPVLSSNNRAARRREWCIFKTYMCKKEGKDWTRNICVKKRVKTGIFVKQLP